jgi:hypothetical protein
MEAGAGTEPVDAAVRDWVGGRALRLTLALLLLLLPGEAV